MEKYSINLLTDIDNEKHKNAEKKRLELLQKSIFFIKNFFLKLDIQELYITGSLIVPGKFTNRSDIDIAVSGLQAEFYFKAISILEENLMRKVEIIELENCSFKEKIRTNGLKII